MSSPIYFSNITKYFQQYADIVESLNSFGLTDESIHAENLFIEILNSVFGWQLKNANEFIKNQSSFDLIDKKRFIYVQVTANKNHKPKFDNAISSFKSPIDKSVEINFIVFFISKKVSKSILGGYKKDNITYEGYDIAKLLAKIYYKLNTPVKLKKLNNLLQVVIYPVLLENNQNTENILSLEIPIQYIPPISKSGFYLKRENLIKNLLNFSLMDNGLLIGGPGFGKSFIINELQRHCHSKKIACYVLRIDDLTIGDDQEISSTIKSPHNWIKTLENKIKKKEDRGLLIFDAFDTAKDDRLKDTVYKQIKKATKDLEGKWNILVSARTYDATKSVLLQDIFPHNRHNQIISCRNFEIPALNEEELEAVLSKNEILSKTFKQSSDRLKRILKTPYFLKLLEQITNENEIEANELSEIETDADLLKVFWTKKIEDLTEKGLFIQKLTKLLVIKESLHIERDEILTDSNIKTFDSLVSLQILQQSNSAEISFTHNILFDYAISKYILTTDITKQIDLLNNNHKLPFIFRQSFIYFYSQLWKEDNFKFWEHYVEIRKIETPLFRLFHQTVLNYILVIFYKNPEELLPYLTHSNLEIQGNIIRRTLESVRHVIKENLRYQDIDLLYNLSNQMQPLFLWEIGNQIQKGIQIYKNESDIKYIKLLSGASCNYLQFVLSRKDDENKTLILRNGAHWGIENLCNTFSFNKIRARSLFKETLCMLKSPGFEISIFHTLSRNLLPIFKSDKNFGMFIYKILYLHNENSKEVTNLGGGIMPLNSNRRQDFNMVHTLLENSYLDFLKIDFTSAMPLGIKIVNKFSGYRRLSYQKERFPIKVATIKAVMYFDHDHYEEDEEHGPYSHVKKVFNFLEEIELDQQSIKMVESYLYLLIAEIQAAKLWRRLLNYLLNNAKHFKNISQEILCNMGMYESDDTLYEAGELLKILWAELSVSEKSNIEKVILNLSQSSIIHPELINRRISLIFNCIPNHDFVLADSKAFITKVENVENKITIKKKQKLMAQSISHTEDELALYAGFDLQNGNDQLLYSDYRKIEVFNDAHRNSQNGNQLKTFSKDIITIAESLFEKIKNENFTHLQIKKSCSLQVSRFANILSRLEKKNSKTEKKFIKAVALHFINETEYKSVIYQTGKMNDRFVGNFTPTPRTESIYTFQNLLYTYNDRDAQNILQHCMSDNDKSIRYRAYCSLNYFSKFNPELFWIIIRHRINEENDGACFKEIVETIQNEQLIASNLSQCEEACLMIIDRLREADDEIIRETWRLFTHAILKIILRHDKEMALKLIRDNLDIKEFSRNLVYDIRSSLNSYNKEDDFISILNKGNVFFEILYEILQYRFKLIEERSALNTDLHDDFEIIDHVIQNLYFAFNFDEGNDNKKKLSIHEKEAFYRKIKPLLEYFANESQKIENGFIPVHTGYYLMLLLNVLLSIDPENILKISNAVILCASNNGFTYERSAVTEVVKLTERVIVDYKSILNSDENFNNLLVILDQFSNSGSEEIIELTWRLKEAFN